MANTKLLLAFILKYYLQGEVCMKYPFVTPFLLGWLSLHEKYNWLEMTRNLQGWSDIIKNWKFGCETRGNLKSKADFFIAMILKQTSLIYPIYCHTVL